MRLLKLVPDNTNLPFVSLRKWAFGLTTLLTLAALAIVFARGLNLGVDFVGGLMIEEKFTTEPSLDKLRKTVDDLNLGEVRLQTVGDNKTVSIKLPPPKSTDEGATNAVVKQVQAAVNRDFPDARFSKQDSVSGKVSGELIWRGVLAVVLAVLGIGLFAIFRFEWQFGVSTVVAIVHDRAHDARLLRASRGWRFDLTIVAAVLTIIGYSINDKIVIDDRIRENMRRYRKMEMPQIIDLSVNETLPRTVMTSLTDADRACSRCCSSAAIRVARLHRGDDPRRDRRDLFVDLRVVLAAHHARPARRAGSGRRADRRRPRSPTRSPIKDVP